MDYFLSLSVCDKEIKLHETQEMMRETRMVFIIDKKQVVNRKQKKIRWIRS